MACPKGSGPAKTTADFGGTYTDGCCTLKVMPCGTSACVCYMLGPVPFSGTPVCPMGENVWGNYVNGFCLVSKEDGIYQNCLGGEKKLTKVEGGAPDAQEMGR